MDGGEGIGWFVVEQGVDGGRMSVWVVVLLVPCGVGESGS